MNGRSTVVALLVLAAIVFGLLTWAVVAPRHTRCVTVIWGVLASPQVDGQVWAHFSTITGNGYRSLARDEDVTFTYLSPGQDGYPHSAVSVTRHSSRARN